MSQSPSDQNKRNFLKLSGFTIAAACLGAKVLSQASTAQAADAAPEAVKATDPMAVSLGYSPDATKVDVKKFPKRAGAAGAKQFCYSCQFFQAKGDPKAAKTAPCTIFSGKLVQNKGWCNTWTQNPKVT
jgi:hypothetical protein